MLESEGMTEKKRGSKGKTSARLDLSSKFWKTLLTVLAAFLTFAGPTYVVYVFIIILKIDYFLSMISGIVLFMIGLALIWYLVKNKIIS
jgi:ABC-type multidrug transport system fused ATPase/permease subunit